MAFYVIALHQLKCYNANMYRVYLNKCHCKLIIKTLDLHKTIIKGEINKISPLMMENKKTQIKYNYDFEESFDFRAHSFFNLLCDLEEEHVKRYFNVLQLYPRSDTIIRVKKKLYLLMGFLSGDLSDVLPVSFSSDEVSVIKLSLELYLVDKNSPLNISSNLIYYKGKWAWDILGMLEGNGSDKIGSIPLIKIEELNDSRCFRN